MAGEGAPVAKPKSELFLRVISAVILALAALGSAWWGGWVFALVWSVIAALVAYEWFTILQQKATGPAWLIGGLLYAGGLIAAVSLLRLSDAYGLAAILFLFFVVWGADVGAYFAGRTFGGPKLAPAISPNKTWSGLIGGLITASLAGSIVLMLTGIALRPMHIVLAAILALVSAMGDLFESFFKRRFGVKDSSNLIPGHGGFMDRLDAFIFAAILAAMIGVARGGVADVGGGLLANW